MTLFTRSYLILSVLLLTTFFASLIVVDNVFESEDSHIFKAESVAELAVAMNWLSDYPKKDWPEAIKLYQPVLDFDVAIKTSGELQQNPGWKADWSKQQPVYLSVEPLDDWWYAQAIAGSDQYLLASESDLEPTTDDWLEVLLPLLGLFVGLGIGFFALSRRTSRYLEDLSLTTTAIGAGDWQERANTNVPQPIHSLAQSVNLMAEQLERTFQDQQIAMGAIPHEIRSPIAKLHFALNLSRNNLDGCDLAELGSN